MYEYHDDDGYDVLTHPNGDFKASFDLTTFGNAETFERAMEQFGFEADEAQKSRSADASSRRFVFHNDNVVVQTCNNPLTGEYYDADMRSDEPGYASYIHVIGEEDAVRDFYDWVQMNAEHIKEASLGKWVV